MARRGQRPNRPLREQVIVIIGASSGIGLATAMAAARAGAKVVLAARNASAIAAAAQSIARDGGTALAVPCDATNYAQLQRVANLTLARFGRIDTWINNAAVTAYAPFTELSVEDFQRIIDVNFIAQAYGARIALPHLEETHGALICMGSTLSDRGVPLQSAYCASKHAIKGWLDSLRVELMHAGSSVRLTLIKPSSMNTPLFSNAKTLIGSAPQPIPPVFDPQLVVAAILHAATSNERDIFVGGSGKLLSVSERVSPKLVDLYARMRFFDDQTTAEPKSDAAPNNLYSPLPTDGVTHGEFTQRMKRRSAYQLADEHVVASSLAGAALMGIGAALLRSRRKDRSLQLLFAAGAIAFTGKAALAATFEH